MRKENGGKASRAERERSTKKKGGRAHLDGEAANIQGGKNVHHDLDHLCIRDHAAIVASNVKVLCGTRRGKRAHERGVSGGK